MQDIEQIYAEYFEIVYKYLFCLTGNSDISETRECNGKKCYVIKEKELQRYYDKENGIRVRTIADNIENNSFGISPVSDFEYKFNVVQDSDIKRPDTTGAIVRKNIQF